MSSRCEHPSVRESVTCYRLLGGAAKAEAELKGDAHSEITTIGPDNVCKYKCAL